jgi:FtsP/CotA-like multicopper oxidase with cupredoxin domain
MPLSKEVLNRREFVQLASGIVACGGAVSGAIARAWRDTAPGAKPDESLHIGKVSWEVAPGKTIKTIGINGRSPGPLVRLKEGQQVTIEVSNDTDAPDLIHWHGLHTPSSVDGALEEGTPFVAARSSRQYSFVPQPSGTRWYHTHTMAMRDLRRATYSGEFGFLYIEPKSEPGAYDHEHFLAFREWDPYMTNGGEGDSSMNVAYKYFSVNSHALGFGEPVRVKPGELVMFRMLNASATMHRRIAIAGHRFRVTALDGNPVAEPKETKVLEMGPAERIDALVQMDHPGVWILGATNDRDREQGLGVVIEYADQSGPPSWIAPSEARWDYRIFSTKQSQPRPEAIRVPLVFEKKWAGNRWVDYWMINGKSYPKTDPIVVRTNQMYRLIFDNRSDEAHPVHLHRHTFELVEVEGTTTSGIWKDVVVVGAKQKLEVEFKANNPGPTLFHCHQQMHMDYGFMTLFKYE